jgi:hypothetical protein
MRIGILGSGDVARTLGSALIARGHDVRLGAREASNEAVRGWSAEEGERASGGTFADAAAFGERVVLNCTAGAHSLDALETARAGLDGKVLIDVANPLDFSGGMPPTLTIGGADSLGERIQSAFPDVHVVKVLNTVNRSVMVDPSRIPGSHNLFMCGDDADAKGRVRQWLSDWFGWPNDAVVDLGDIRAARATEPFVLLWVLLWQATGTSDVSVRVVRA